MANFLQNLWKKVGSPVAKFATTALGAIPLVGGALKAVSSGLISKVDSNVMKSLNKVTASTQEKMINAVTQQGVVKTAEIEKTVLKETGQPATAQDVEVIATALSQQTDAPIDNPVETNPLQKMVNGVKVVLGLETNNNQTSPSGIMDFIKKYWFIFLGAFGVYYAFFRENTKRWRR